MGEHLKDDLTSLPVCVILTYVQLASKTIIFSISVVPTFLLSFV